MDNCTYLTVIVRNSPQFATKNDCLQLRFYGFLLTGKCNKQSDIVDLWSSLKACTLFKLKNGIFTNFLDIDLGREFDFPSFKGNSLRWWQSNN